MASIQSETEEAAVVTSRRAGTQLRPPHLHVHPPTRTASMKSTSSSTGRCLAALLVLATIAASAASAAQLTESTRPTSAARNENADMLEAGAYNTLVHFSAQLEPCLTHEYTLHILNTP